MSNVAVVNGQPIQEWLAVYDEPANGVDQATSMEIDASGNVYVTGWSTANGSAADYTTIKYNNVLVNENQNAGTYSFEWNAFNFASGIHFYKLVTDGLTETMKMNLIK